VTGALPATTTAAPLRDLAFTRRLIELNEQHGSMPLRFSILNLKILDRLYRTFSANELLGVDLVLQNTEAATPKSPSGRARVWADKSPARGALMIEGATCACVSGFPVNMVERRIQLISPTLPCERWPLGYRQWGERSFTSALEFRWAVEELIAEHMPSGPVALDRLRFRSDLAYRREAMALLSNLAAGAALCLVSTLP